MLFLEDGLFSYYIRQADEQQRVPCFRDTQVSAGLFSGAKEKAHILKKSACNQNKLFNSGMEACYGPPDKSLCCGVCFQLSSARNVRATNPGQCVLKFPLCSKDAALCPGAEIFLGKRHGQRAAVSCWYNQPFGDY